mmetsp:Transcript_53087/g.116235  ORF Transcript_53087/g.116235 Transcript_53087/m.116235 type:complete len:275 (+) Transcript_53087:759-1583(+)
MAPAAPRLHAREGANSSGGSLQQVPIGTFGGRPRGRFAGGGPQRCTHLRPTARAAAGQLRPPTRFWPRPTRRWNPNLPGPQRPPQRRHAQFGSPPSSSPSGARPPREGADRARWRPGHSAGLGVHLSWSRQHFLSRSAGSQRGRCQRSSNGSSRFSTRGHTPGFPHSQCRWGSRPPRRLARSSSKQLASATGTGGRPWGEEHLADPEQWWQHECKQHRRQQHRRQCHGQRRRRWRSTCARRERCGGQSEDEQQRALAGKSGSPDRPPAISTGSK